MDNQEWTIKNGQSRMDNPDVQATLGTQNEDKQYSTQLL